LLLFCACCLYSLERALEKDGKNSVCWMVVSAAALYLALLSHYSALIFAVAVGAYALVSLLEKKWSAKLTAAWVAAQAGAVAICVFLYESQISKLRQSGLPSEIAATWLRSSIFQHEQQHLAAFLWKSTLRLFRYFFSQGTIGVVGLGLFAFAILVLLSPDRHHETRPQNRVLAMLLALPFLITLALAIAGFYPYGGTRHDALLALFAITAVAIGLNRLPIGRSSISANFLKPLLLGIAMLICNLFPSPSGPYIQPQNQRRELMHEAIRAIRSLPRDSVLFTDAQGSMVLNYYLCDGGMLLPFTPEKSLLRFPCGDYYVLASMATQAGFDHASFSELLSGAWKQVPNETSLYLFQSGWIDDKEDDWVAELRGQGGSPHNFGPNILLTPFPRNEHAGLEHMPIGP
jgi:hypothetical protein